MTRAPAHACRGTVRKRGNVRCLYMRTADARYRVQAVPRDGHRLRLAIDVQDLFLTRHPSRDLDGIEAALHHVRPALDLADLVWENQPQTAFRAFQLPFSKRVQNEGR